MRYTFSFYFPCTSISLLCNSESIFLIFEGNYLINYLASRGPELQSFVTGSLIQLLCRITKYGWFDDDRFREVVKESMNFLSQVMSHAFAVFSCRSPFIACIMLYVWLIKKKKNNELYVWFLWNFVSKQSNLESGIFWRLKFSPFLLFFPCSSSYTKS